MSMSAQAYNQYQRTSVETLTPGKLLLMLYDGAIKNISAAREDIDKKDINAAHLHIVVAQKILVELMTTLNMEYEIAENLYALYEYLYNQLVAANVKKDKALLLEVQEFLSDLREAWEQAVKNLGRNRVYQANSLQHLNVTG